MRWPLGVFSSLDAGLGVKLDVARQLGVPTIHLHAPLPQNRSQAVARQFRERLDEAGIAVTVVFASFEGESYADIPTVARTVGLVPAATREARLAELQQIAQFARWLGVDVVGLHLGYIPHEPSDPVFSQVVEVTRRACDVCRDLGQNVHLETGQEPADALLAFIQATGRGNLFSNFDPANMILYGSGEPIAALEKLGPYVRSVHCKDAKWASQPGQEWGHETPLGAGDVDIDRFIDTLARIGYEGPLTIEREIAQEPQRQQQEIAQAMDLLTRLQAKYA